MTIKFLTLNIWDGGKCMDEIISFLRQQNADIVMLQEAYNSANVALPPQARTQQVLREALGYPHDNFAAAFMDYVLFKTEPVESGNLILSRFPIRAHDAIFLNEPYAEHHLDNPEGWKKQPQVLQHVQLETPAGELDVFNLHGVWDLDGDNFSDRRRRMRDKVLQAIAGKKHVLLAGDTNAKPTNRAMQDIAAQLKSVFGHDLQTTFNVRRKDLKKFPGYATAVVDMIFVSPDIEVVSRDCPHVDLSDHLPLTASLRIPD